MNPDIKYDLTALCHTIVKRWESMNHVKSQNALNNYPMTLRLAISVVREQALPTEKARTNLTDLMTFLEAN